MLKKMICAVTATILLWGCAPKETLLQKRWPRHGGARLAGYHYDISPVRNGCIIFKSKDTLCGIIKIREDWASGDPIEILPQGKKYGDDVLKINRDSIAFIRVYADSGINKNVFTDYFGFRYKGVYEFRWGIYAQKNSIVIYFFDNSASKQGIQKRFSHMALATPKDTTVMEWNRIFYQEFDAATILLRFINNRYNQHFKKEDFTDGQAMADYILNKENERLNGK